MAKKMNAGLAAFLARRKTAKGAKTSAKMPMKGKKCPTCGKTM